MNNMKTIVNTILSTVAAHTDYTVDELEDRLGTDEIAAEVEAEMEAEMDAYSDDEPDFDLELDEILSYYKEPITLSFFQLNGRLYMQTVLVYENEYVEGREEAVEAFMTENKLASLVSLEDDALTLLLEAECDADDIADIERTLSAYLETILENEEFAEVITKILEM